MRDSRSPHPGWEDEQLVTLCLKGSEAAWGALIEKYKNLVFTVILRYGVSQEDSADLFQAVWLEVHNDLDKLRNRNTVKPWLISIVRNTCYHWQNKKRRVADREITGEEPETLEESAGYDPTFTDDLEQDQLIREAIQGLSDRCRELVLLLFFSQPPLAYKDVAERLGIAVGSIGFIRGRCLKKLQRQLEDLGIE